MSRAIQHLEIEANWSTLAGPLPPFPPNLRWSGCRGSGEPKIRSITASRNLRNWLKMLKETLSYEGRFVIFVIRSHTSPWSWSKKGNEGHVQTPATQAMEEQLQLLRHVTRQAPANLMQPGKFLSRCHLPTQVRSEGQGRVWSGPGLISMSMANLRRANLRTYKLRSRSLAGHHITPLPLAVRIYESIHFETNMELKPWQIMAAMKQSSPRARQVVPLMMVVGMARCMAIQWSGVKGSQVSQLGIATWQWHIWRIACLVGAAKSSKSQFHLTLRNLGSGPFTFEVFDAFRGQKSCELPWLIMVPVAQHDYLQHCDSGKHAKYALEMNLSTNGGGQEICHD